MAEQRDKTNPDYPVTPAWRPASQPGVRLPAPSLEPVRPASDVIAPVPEPEARPQLARRPWETARPISHSSYSLVPASQESIRPLAMRSSPSVEVVHPVSQPAYAPVYVAPTIAPVVPAAPRPVSQPAFRPASDGYVRPASGAVAIDKPALSDGAAGRRADDPTRLLPWLRDKNKRFKALTDAEADAIFHFASLHRVEVSTLLQSLDAPPTACFAVISGTVVMRSRRPNGALRELDRFGPGEVTGLLALVDERPSPYELVAASSVEIIAFEADKLALYTAAFHPQALLAVRAWTPMLVEHMRALHQRVARVAHTRRGRVESRDDDAWRGIK